MKPNENCDMGHKPRYELRKHQVSARERGISRKEFLGEHNNPTGHRAATPATNRGRKFEDETDEYGGD